MPEAEVSKPQRIVEVGSLQCPYKLCIAGGGPSGCSVLIRAIRIGVCDELCDFVYPPSSSSSKKNEGDVKDDPILGGVCIIDKGSAEKFGGGKLSEYQINSNTWANKFVTNITNDKLDVTPSETVNNTVLSRLKTMPNAIEVESYGTKNVPLCTVGALLCDAGRMICTQIAKFRNSSAVLTDTTVCEIHRIQTKSFSGWRVVTSRTNIRGLVTKSDIYCKNLVLCTGGLQRAPTLSCSQHNNKLLTSDFVCTTEGINEVRRRLMHHYLSVGHTNFHNGTTKVAIVGGSHSAFSAAWMCLNKITFPDNMNSLNPKSFSINTNSITFPSSPTNKSVKLLTSRKDDIYSYDDIPSTAATTLPGSPTEFSKGGTNGDTSVSSSRRTSFSISVTGSLDDRSSVVMNGTITPKANIRKIRLDNEEEVMEVVSVNVSADVSALNSPRKPTTAGGSVTTTPSSAQPHHIMTELPGILTQLFQSPKPSSPMRSPSLQKNANNNGFMSPHKAPSSPAKGIREAPSNPNGPNFQRNSIVMLHRSPIEVFYATKAEADSDSYPVEPNEIGKVTGQIHPFGGLRGDAKELWRAVRNTKGAIFEQRLKLMMVKGVTTVGDKSVTQPGGHVIKNSLSDKIMDDAVVIIWACGYNTNSVPVYDTNGALIPLRIFRGQVEIDDKGNVMADDGYTLSTDLTVVNGNSEAINFPVIPSESVTEPTNDGNVSTSSKQVKKIPSTPATPTGNVLPNLMGNGLGYGFKATLENGQLDGSSGRADGVAVYLKRGATLILAKVLGNKVYGGDGNFKSWEERNLAIRKQNNMNARVSLEEKERQVAAANKTMNEILASVNSLSASITPNGQPKSVNQTEVKSTPVTPARKITNQVEKPRSIAASPVTTSSKHTTQPGSTIETSTKPRLNSAPLNNNNNNNAINGQKKVIPLPLNLEASLDRLSQPRVIDTSNTLYTSGDFQKAKKAADSNPRSVSVKRNNFVEPTSGRSGKSQPETQSTSKKDAPSPSLKNRVISTSNESSDNSLPVIKSSVVATPPHSSGSVTGSLLSDGEFSSTSENSVEVKHVVTTVASASNPATKIVPLPGKQVKLTLPQIKNAVGNTITSNALHNQQAIYIYSPDKAKTVGQQLVDMKSNVKKDSNNRNSNSNKVVVSK